MLTDKVVSERWIRLKVGFTPNAEKYLFPKGIRGRIGPHSHGPKSALERVVAAIVSSVQCKTRFELSIPKGLAPHEAVGRIKPGLLLTA